MFSREEQLSSPLSDILIDLRFKNLNEKKIYQDKQTGLEILIYECPFCNQYYYVCHSEEQFSEFDSNQEELFMNWFNHDNSILGKEPKGISPYGIDRSTFPCKVKLHTSEEIDFCAVTLYKEFPFFHIIPRRENIMFLHEISELLISEYAFKTEVREDINRSFEKQASRLDLGIAYLKVEKISDYFKIQGIPWLWRRFQLISKYLHKYTSYTV